MMWFFLETLTPILRITVPDSLLAYFRDVFKKYQRAYELSLKFLYRFAAEIQRKYFFKWEQVE